MQAAIGSNMLQLPATFSQMAHSVHSLAALNTVPGNSYRYARPTKPACRAGSEDSNGQPAESSGRTTYCLMCYLHMVTYIHWHILTKHAASMHVVCEVHGTSASCMFKGAVRQALTPHLLSARLYWAVF